MINAPIDYSSFFNKRAKRRKPSPIREFHNFMSIPDMISLGGGNPNSSLFPIDRIEVKLKNDSKEFKLDGNILNEALQYSSSYGLPSLTKLLKENLMEEHEISSNQDISIIITTGSQDGITKVLDTILDEEDSIIVEEPSYAGVMAFMKSMNLNIVGIEIDSNGMKSDKLSMVLEKWDSIYPQKKKPKAMYIIPTGQNPSGSTMSNERKAEIYKIAQKHNMLILEDDPYWHLRLVQDTEKPKSFLSMDVDGRVIRFESFSKIFSSGFRIGFVAGPFPIIEKVLYFQQTTCLHTSGLTQAILYNFLITVGKDGWKKHLKSVQDFYAQKKDFCIAMCEKYLSGLASWTPPKAGMFLWLKLINIENVRDFVFNECIPAKILILPGSTCVIGEKSDYVRISFSTATNEEMEEAIKRLADLLRKKKANS